MSVGASDIPMRLRRSVEPRARFQDMVLASMEITAAAVDRHPDTLRNWVKQGKFPPPVIDRKPGERSGSVMFDVAQVMAWIRAGCPTMAEWKRGDGGNGFHPES